MELYVLLTVLGHILLAMLVGAHAEVTGRRHWRWAPIVLVTGLLGVLWYAVSSPPTDETVESPFSAADVPEEYLENRPREKRLSEPNTLHVDLPDGTTLTGSEQQAVGAVIKRLDGDEAESDGVEFPSEPPADHLGGTGGGGSPGADSNHAVDEEASTETIIEEVFDTHRAGYVHPAVWWTDCVRPALEALPDVEPPSDDDGYRLDLELREVYDEEPGTTLVATDGERTGTFRLVNGEVEAASPTLYAETSLRWVEFAKDRIVDDWEERDWSVDAGERETETTRR